MLYYHHANCNLQHSCCSAAAAAAAVTFLFSLGLVLLSGDPAVVEALLALNSDAVCVLLLPPSLQPSFSSTGFLFSESQRR
jgi:hypothetical protein